MKPGPRTDSSVDREKITYRPAGTPPPLHGGDLPGFFVLVTIDGIWNVTGAVTLPPRVYRFAVTSYNSTSSDYRTSSMPQQ